MVWDKRSEPGKIEPQDADNKFSTSEFELVWSKAHHHRTIARFLRSMGFYAAPEDRYGHPTLKPVKLCAYFLEEWGKKEGLVVDLYGGSGSTLIAAEKTGRRCFTMEIDPQYCQVILERWAAFTGQDPTRADGTGLSTLLKGKTTIRRVKGAKQVEA
jgi:DNA modification methylase